MLLQHLSLFLTGVSTASSLCSSQEEMCWTSTTLDASVNFVARHRVHNNTLHLKLDADSIGWLGFGIADPNSGHMKGSDLVTVSVVSGNVRVEDRYAPFAPSTYTPESGNGYQGLTALEDERNHWTAVSGEESNGRTSVYITRLLNTMDTQDRRIFPGKNRILWSRGQDDNVGYHGVYRGIAQITFFEAAEEVPFPEYDGIWEMRVRNFTILPATTRYICQSFKLDTSGGDKHIVAIRPIRVRKYHHHALLHICVDNDYWAYHETPRVCTADNALGGVGLSPLGHFKSGCAGQVWIWGAGAGDFLLPREAGFRVGDGSHEISHLIFEIHYDNPAHESGIIDDFGFQLFWTKNLRPHDAGQITLGDPTITFGIWDQLPGGRSKVHRQATCPSVCTRDFDQPIHVFAQLLHMHHYGQKIYTEHYASNGSMLGVPNRIDFWDNGFQPVHEKHQFIINPGDVLQTHCFYNTAGTGSRSVTFGLGTGEEMCMDFLFYYPAQYRGTTESGKPLPFAFCAQRSEKTIIRHKLSVCGSLTQTGTHSVLFGTVDLPNAVIWGGQSSTGEENFEDPVRFGISPASFPTISISSTSLAPPNGLGTGTSKACQNSATRTFLQIVFGLLLSRG